eukprot:TRINITY_DN6618_c0_g1_i1.p1 TRINITY_DN6618_c0_g1~~TRINITY_DN6618_c0_g1_i1.p1  ORF type:complete len:318 (+),score=46.66 TRINITY_DN6618_c0_g1_i1:31-984(+)
MFTYWKTGESKKRKRRIGISTVDGVPSMHYFDKDGQPTKRIKVEDFYKRKTNQKQTSTKTQNRRKQNKPNSKVSNKKSGITNTNVDPIFYPKTQPKNRSRRRNSRKQPALPKRKVYSFPTSPKVHSRDRRIEPPHRVLNTLEIEKNDIKPLEDDQSCTLDQYFERVNSVLHSMSESSSPDTIHIFKQYLEWSLETHKGTGITVKENQENVAMNNKKLELKTRLDCLKLENQKWDQMKSNISKQTKITVSDVREVDFSSLEQIGENLESSFAKIGDKARMHIDNYHNSEINRNDKILKHVAKKLRSSNASNVNSLFQK